VSYLFEVPLPSYDPGIFTLYIRVSSILYLFNIHTGMGGGGELTREKVRGAIVHKAGGKYQLY
jgi:hypothetical protein